jgi:hypothetical protein
LANKVVILEGPDGCGKTTLAAHLVEQFGFEYRHEGPPPLDCDRLHYYGNLLLEAHKGTKPVVFDRFHLGEVVYGPIKRYEDKLGYSGMWLMQRLIEATGTRLFVCLPPYEVANGSWYDKYAAGNDYLMSQTLFHDSYYRFKALSGYFGFYDWTKKGDERNMKRVLEAYFDDPIETLPVGATGYKQARVLFVGEQANHPAMDIPFFSMTNSSGYLNSVLWEAGFSETDMVFTNVKNIKGASREIKPLVDQLAGLRKVVALGTIAGQHLKNEGIDHELLFHPSYFRRFNSLKRDTYVAQMRAIRGGLQ